MKKSKFIDKERDTSLLWISALFAAIYYIGFAVYNGSRTQSLVGAIASVVFTTFVGLMLISGLALMRVLISKLDPHNFRGEFSLYLRQLLRKKPKIRAWLASWIILPLITILLLDVFVGLFSTGNITSYIFFKTVGVIALLSVLISLIETKFPDRTGKVVPYNEVRILLDDGLRDARVHFEKAVSFFDNEIEPQYENCIKEAVCALEACVETFTKKPASKDFTKIVKQLQGKEAGEIPPAIAQGMIKLYAYRGDGKAIAHAALQGSSVSDKEAELVLNLVASYITYLDALYSSDKNDKL